MAETPTPEAVAAQSVVILGYCSTHPGVPFIEDMADHTAFCPLCEYLGTRRALTEQARRITAPIVVMCGSTRFRFTWIEEYGRLTDEGFIVLSVGRMLPKVTGAFDPVHKARLDELHKRKIDLADWVWVLDVGGYIGESTKSEIAYAETLGRPVRFLSREYPQYVEPPDPSVEQAREIERATWEAAADMLGSWNWDTQALGRLVARFRDRARAAAQGGSDG